MSAAKRNIKIEKGATFQMNLTWKDGEGVPVNLTGYTARMQVRKNVNATDTLLNMTTENGSIALGGALGTISITGSATNTSAIPDTIKTGVYDLELVNGSVVKRLIEGNVEISPEVTK